MRRYLDGRRRPLIAATVLVSVGVASSWNWLAAFGIAPLVLSVLPCAAMCALGLCMGRMGGSRPPWDGVLDKSPRSSPSIDRPLTKAADRGPSPELSGLRK